MDRFSQAAVISDRNLWLAAGVAAGLALGIFAFTHKSGGPGQSTQPFQVDATEVDGRLRLTWNPDLPQIRVATGGTLEVRDGDRSESHPIDGKVLQNGSLDYIRGSDNALLSVTLMDNGKPGSQSVIRVVAPVVAPPAAPPPSASARTHTADHSGKVAKTKKVVKTKKVAKAKKPAKRPPSLTFVPHD